MGRRKINPIDQAARGNPSKVAKGRLAKAIAEAERQAKLLALPRTDDTSDSPPAYLEDPRLAPAMAVWREYAPRLDRLHLLARLDRHTFALFCVYAGEFVVANEDVLIKGYSTRVKTISGDHMLRENPSVSRRDFAAKMVLELSGKFGLTPDDRNKLLRAGAMQFDDQTLFGRVRDTGAPQTDAPADRPAPSPVHGAAAIGSLANFDSSPPGAKPN